MYCVEITMDWSDDAKELLNRIRQALLDNGLTAMNVDILDEQGEVIAEGEQIR